jgi:hypothetical protein
MSTRVLTTACFLTMLAALGGVSAVHADGSLEYGSTGASVQPGAVTVSAAGSSMKSGTSDGGSTVNCTYTPVDPTSAYVFGTGGPTPGAWTVPYCAGEGYVNPMLPVWVPAGNASAASPAVLARQAVSRLPLPQPIVGMSPAPSDVIVNVPTWMWIDGTTWRGLTATASVGQVSATARAAPAEVVWDLGDGGQVTCDGPGTPWTSQQPADWPSDCSHTYSRSSADQPNGMFTVTTTMYWRVTWASAGAPGGGDLGLVPGPSFQTTVRVGEVHAVNDGPSG